MADFEEWYEGTGGVDTGKGASASPIHDDAQDNAWERSEDETILCLVDCSDAMFRSSSAPLASPPSSGFTSTTSTATEASPSYFAMTMQSIRKLLAEKLISSKKDAVGLLLYNTRETDNDAGFAGICVARGADQIDRVCVECVEQLEAAGVYGSPEYESFLTKFGHSRDQRRTSENEDSDESFPCRFSNVLQAAGQLLSKRSDSSGTVPRRLFVFTNDSDPSRGCQAERSACCAQVHVLANAGAFMEVFGFEHEVGQEVFELPNTSNNQTMHYSHNHEALLNSVSPSSSTPRTVPFQPAIFWSKLLEEQPAPLPPLHTGAVDAQRYREGADIAAAAGDARAATTATPRRRSAVPVNGVGIGTLHVYAGTETLQQLLRTVTRRAHPQQPHRHYELRIGRAASQQQLQPGKERTSASTSLPVAVPRMAVSLYLPLLPARAPPAAHVDRYTSELVRRVVRLEKESESGENQGVHATSNTDVLPPAQLQSETTAERAKETYSTGEGGALRADEICYYAKIGGNRVFFTAEERRQLIEGAAGDAELGFTILLFKDIADALQPAQVVQRASFLHARVDSGGLASHRLFVLLVRRLRTKGKAAIAQYRSTLHAAPRLVALVPAPNLESDGDSLRRSQLPVQGLGLYVVPLPYAEDLRPLPDLRMCTSVNPTDTPCLANNTVKPEHEALARRVVAALTVNYSIDKVPNPTLQREYAVLQHLARCRAAPPHNEKNVSPLNLQRSLNGQAEERCAKDEAATATVVAGASAAVPVDASLPDYNAMSAYKPLFDVFKSEVLGSGYDPFFYCPNSIASTRAVRRPPTAPASEGEASSDAVKDAIRDAAARNAWDFLTVRVLKAYLASIGVGMGGARCKTDLIALARAHTTPAEP